MIILVTVGSASCDRALETAAQRSLENEIPLRLVYVADTSFLDQVAREMTAERRTTDHLAHIGKLIMKRQAKKAEEITSVVEAEVVRGNALDVLPGYLDRQQAHAVFIGRECLHALARLHDEDELLDALEATGIEVDVIE
ncbi:MAG: universal stress protein [Candidatus Thermoplasmatota archaeon]|nr:universal stress protein [Candidatus Thermoplasmatota archaeon]